MGYLRGEVEVFDADIIGITESWTDGSICDAEILELEPILACLLYTSPSPRDRQKSRMPSSA